ncbi:TIGR03619 family F420-dependent LLM class oxidoreductase [Streptomyces kaempferi]
MKQYDIGRDVPAVARAAEETGYESLWVFERVLFPEPATQGLYGIPGLPWPDTYRSVADPLVTLTLAAASTGRARLGTSVLVAPLHVPFQLARSLATLDAASGGRVVAGLGTGWSHDEYAAAGVAPFDKRGKVLDEILDVCAAVWGPDPVSYEGEITTIAPSVVGPKPARPIPVYLLGEQPAGAASAGRPRRRLDAGRPGRRPAHRGMDPAQGTGRRARQATADRGLRPGQRAVLGQALRGRRASAVHGQRGTDRRGPGRTQGGGGRGVPARSPGTAPRRLGTRGRRCGGVRAGPRGRGLSTTAEAREPPPRSEHRGRGPRTPVAPPGPQSWTLSPRAAPPARSRRRRRRARGWSGRSPRPAGA